MIQNLIVLLIFLAALAYLGRMLYRSFQEKSCASGCGKCGVDFSKLEKQIQKKGLH
jgi:hypothetical protein